MNKHVQPQVRCSFLAALEGSHISTINAMIDTIDVACQWTGKESHQRSNILNPAQASGRVGKHSCTICRSISSQSSPQPNCAALCRYTASTVCVFTRPGLTALTGIPVPASSLDRLSVRDVLCLNRAQPEFLVYRVAGLADELPIERAIPQLPPAPNPHGHHHLRAMGSCDVAEIEDIAPAKAA